MNQHSCQFCRSLTTTKTPDFIDCLKMLLNKLLVQELHSKSISLFPFFFLSFYYYLCQFQFILLTVDVFLLLMQACINFQALLIVLNRQHIFFFLVTFVKLNNIDLYPICSHSEMLQQLPDKNMTPVMTSTGMPSGGYSRCTNVHHTHNYLGTLWTPYNVKKHKKIGFQRTPEYFYFIFFVFLVCFFFNYFKLTV